jgi:xylulokinase
MYLGVDLGTSALKVMLVDDHERAVDEVSVPLDVQRPRPLWSEQDPEAWWQALQAAITALHQRRPAEVAAVRAIGLAGQMHGAVLLDVRNRVLRRAILWNDGRSGAQCATLEARAPRSREITGNLAMPGFTAPKLLWVAEHEPRVFERVHRVLLPKDYLRLRLSGDYASDMSDAAGSLWLDVGRRAWSAAMLAATDLSEAAMPRLFEGSEPTGVLRSSLASGWGMRPDVVIAGGAGDNAAGAVGVGVIRPGQALLSLGTSGVYFVATSVFTPNPQRAVHTFCHCLPGTWHQMSVILSAASCLSWVATVTGSGSEAALLAEITAADRDPRVLFLPYLSGERTPHNDPQAKGVFFGLTHATTRADLGRAVLEGVACALAEGQEALLAGGSRIDEVSVIGGGARSAYWGRILASVLDRPLRYYRSSECGPAFGATRLARLALTGEDPQRLCVSPPVERVLEPDPGLRQRYVDQLAVYRRLYGELRATFAYWSDAQRNSG